jgi:hypothetical protein
MWLEHGDSGDAVRRVPVARMKRSLTTEKTLPPELLANALRSRADSKSQAIRRCLCFRRIA